MTKDIHELDYSERLKFLNKLSDSDHIKKAETRIVDNEADLCKSVKYFASQEGSEGCYLKVFHGFPYELDGQTRFNIKFKNTFQIDAKVIDIHKVKDAEAWNYLCVLEDGIPVGRTYNTSIKVNKGDVITVEFVNINRYSDPETDKVFFNWWSPHVLRAREKTKKPDSVSTAEKLVNASKGTVTEKPFPKRYEDAYPIEDSDPYLVYPDEGKRYKGMVHSHIRGRSVHLDIRFQVSKDYMVGWTLYIPKGLSKDPETFAEAKALNEKEIMHIVRETMSNPMKKFNSGPKEAEPIEWATYEGTVQPGSIGATKNEHGHFIIIDSFEVQFGAQKSYFHEVFCDGKIFKGRLIFRLLENKEEWKRTDEGLLTWFMFNALKSPTPYVISTRAVKKAWCSPFDVSALPRNIRDKIPDKYRFWKIKDTTKRREVRDQLVNEIKNKLLKLDAIKKGKFKVLKQTFKGQKVIRTGPSKTQYFFVTKLGKSSYWAFVSDDDITSSTSVAGLIFKHAAKLWNAEGDISPSTKLNQTKATPSQIEVLDEGEVTMLREAKGEFLKFLLKGKKLKGLFSAYAQNGGSMWNFKKSRKKPNPKKDEGDQLS